MAKRLDDVLHGLGVNPEHCPESGTPRAKETTPLTTTGLPLRFERLLQADGELKALFEGHTGTSPDRTPSGKDMVLGHQCRRLGFQSDEVREILRQAPYRVEGGRTPDYLDRTIGKIFSETPRQGWASSRKITEGFGMLPARLLDGTWADLSFKAAKLYVVLLVRRMRPSGIVRDSKGKLAQWAGIRPDSVGPAGTELEAKGLIRRAPHRSGMNYWVNDLTCTEENAAHVGREEVKELGAEDKCEPEPLPTGTADSTSGLFPVHVNTSASVLSSEQVVLVMSGMEPSARRSTPPIQCSEEEVAGERKGENTAVADRRCQALTKARLECGLRAVSGERFCRWHQPKEKALCVPVA